MDTGSCTSGAAVLAMSAEAAVLTALAAMSHPRSALPPGSSSVALPAAALAVHVLAASLTAPQRDRGVRTALAVGSRCGAILAVASLPNMILEHYADFGSAGGAAACAILRHLGRGVRVTAVAADSVLL